ncbi:MAG: transglycosylase SLT domain-containing protein [Nitrospirae bacterium]|nr:transglycosylase SLT domain-containing protein [Nitrospirota bacterium]
MHLKKIYIISGIAIVCLLIINLKVFIYATYNEIAETKQIILEAKERYPRLTDIDESLILSLIEVESKFNRTSVGNAGEIGLMQIKPSTYIWINEYYGIDGGDAMTDRFDNIVAGMHFLYWLRIKLNGSVFKSLQAYNVGLKGLQDGNFSIIYALKIYAGSFKYRLI